MFTSESAKYVIVHEKETKSSGEGKVTVGWAERFPGQRTEGQIESPRKKTEPPKCRQGQRMTFPHGFYIRRVLRDCKKFERENSSLTLFYLLFAHFVTHSCTPRALFG